MTPAVSASTFTCNVKWGAYWGMLKTKGFRRKKKLYRKMNYFDCDEKSLFFKMSVWPTTSACVKLKKVDTNCIMMQCYSNPLRKVENILDVCWCSAFTVSHLSGSQMDHLLIPALKPTRRKCFQTVSVSHCEHLGEAKQEPHGWGSTAAWGMLASTFKRVPVGFMKLETQKRRSPLNVPRTKGSPH